MQRFSAAAMIAAVVFLAACSDGPSAPRTTEGDPSYGLSPKAAANMTRYVAIGTSLSMGWTSDGVQHTDQASSWPAQLAEMAGVSFAQPLIEAPGCQPSYAAPLISFKRVDNSTALAPSSVCAANLALVTLPTQNVAVENATAREALTATPATAAAGRGPVTSRALGAGMTQVSAMESMNPTFVSVELGGNEVLPAQVGILFPNVTFVPYATFAANYTQIIDRVVATGAGAVLATLRIDIRDFPTIRTGPEIASQRSAFAAYNVTVNSNCDASSNLIFVRGKVITAIATGLGRAAAGLGPYDLSCADVPFTADFVLTPGDVTFINALIDQMSTLIETKAADNGYAVFPLNALYGKSKDDVPFDLVSFLTSSDPYGPTISLDGVHPTAKGQAILARAARVAIQKTYGTGAP